MSNENENAESKLKYKMSQIKGKDTKPEILVRSILHKAGFRFRKNVDNLPGKPDIVLPKYKTVIFVQGCFWHQHPGCSKCKIPKSNVDFWKKKLGGNVERDIKNKLKLQNENWNVIYVWECELKNIDNLTKQITSQLTSK